MLIVYHADCTYARSAVLSRSDCAPVMADASAEEGSAEASGTSNVTKDAVHQLQVNEKIMAGEWSSDGQRMAGGRVSTAAT